MEVLKLYYEAIGLYHHKIVKRRKRKGKHLFKEKAKKDQKCKVFNQ